MNTAARGIRSLSLCLSLIPLSNGRDDGRELHCKSIMSGIRFLTKKKNNTLSLSLSRERSTAKTEMDMGNGKFPPRAVFWTPSFSSLHQRGRKGEMISHRERRTDRRGSDELPPWERKENMRDCCRHHTTTTTTTTRGGCLETGAPFCRAFRPFGNFYPTIFEFPFESIDGVYRIGR
jgi:hypothetical protein